VEEYEIPEDVIAVASKSCDCCPECQQHPCDGALAGGLCDQIRCVCDELDQELYYGED